KDLGGDGVLELRVVGEDRGVRILPHLPKRADRLLLRAIVPGGVSPGVVLGATLPCPSNGDPHRLRWEVRTLPDLLGLEVDDVDLRDAHKKSPFVRNWHAD